MRKRLANKLKMYNTVQLILNQNAAVWEPVPAVADTIRTFSSLIEKIDLYEAKIRDNKKGITAQKEVLQDQVIRDTYEVASAMYVMAERTKDPVLAAKVNYTETDLLKTRDGRLVILCLIIVTLATEHLASLAAYGVTEEELVTLREEIDRFSESLPGPRLTVAERKAANEAMRGLFGQVDELLKKQLDRLMVRFRKSQPDFYGLYKYARRIVHYGIRHEKPKVPENEGGEQ